MKTFRVDFSTVSIRDVFLPDRQAGMPLIQCCIQLYYLTGTGAGNSQLPSNISARGLYNLTR